MDTTTPKLAPIGTICIPDTTTKFSRPVLLTKVHAGFPSPAENYIAKRLDLNLHIVKRQESTFFIYVEGDSMIGENIQEGDIIVVDRMAERYNKDIVVVRVGQDFCIRKYRKEQGREWFEAANPKYAPIEVNEESDTEIWGRVTFSFREH